MPERQKGAAGAEERSVSDEGRKLRNELADKNRDLRKSLDGIRNLEGAQTTSTSVGLDMSDLEDKVKNMKIELEIFQRKRAVAESALATSERCTADLRRANEFWMSKFRKVMQFIRVLGASGGEYGGAGPSVYGGYNAINHSLEAFNVGSGVPSYFQVNAGACSHTTPSYAHYPSGPPVKTSPMIE